MRSAGGDGHFEVRRKSMKITMGPKTLLYPAPVLIVGTYDKEGKPNAAAVSWGGIACSNPPAVCVSLRKATYTYGNMMEKKAFTVNIPSEDYVRQADYFGMVSGREEDKFKAAALTPVRSDLVDAPYIGEFPLILECRLLRSVEIGLHTQFIGEVKDVKAEESILDENGGLDIRKLRPFFFTPDTRLYYAAGPLLGPAFSMGRGLRP